MKKVIEIETYFINWLDEKTEIYFIHDECLFKWYVVDFNSNIVLDNTEDKEQYIESMSCGEITSLTKLN